MNARIARDIAAHINRSAARKFPAMWSRSVQIAISTVITHRAMINGLKR